MSCDVIFDRIHPQLLPHSATAVTRDDIFSGCWGERLAARVRGSRVEGVMAVAGLIFAKVVRKMFKLQKEELLQGKHEYTFTYEKMVGAVKFFLDGSKNDQSPILFILAPLLKIYPDPRPEDNETFLKALKKVLKLSFAQHLFDPLMYVPHDYTHARTVTLICRMLCSQAEIKTTIIDSAAKYQLTPTVLQALIELAGFLHDCGYPHLRDLSKGNHAMYSADRVDGLIKLLKKLQPAADPLVFAHFRKAVFFHNADEGRDKFNRRLITSSGDFVCKKEHEEEVLRAFEDPAKTVIREVFEKQIIEETFGRKVDLFTKKDGKLGIERTEGIIDDNAFHVLRVADNLDFLVDRLTDTHKDEQFLGTCRRQHDRGVANHPDKKAEYAGIVIDEYSFRHFGGCAVFKTLSPNIINGAMVISLTSGERFQTYDDIRFIDEKDKTSIARYQLLRARRAFESIRLTSDTEDHLAKGLVFRIDGRDFKIDKLENK